MTTASSNRASLALQWSSSLLFPMMIVSFALNQTRPMPVVVAIGQVASIAATLLAFVVVLTALPDSNWSTFLFGVLLTLRGARFAVVESASLDVAYTVALAAVCSAACALIVVRQPGLLQRQFAVFCALSIPLMFLQIIGVEWTQVLRTDLGPPELRYGMVRTLFAPAGQLVINTVQPRPAGVLHANNAASVVAAFGLALHYGRLPGSGRVSWADWAVLTVSVLLMAKLTFVVIIALWLMRAAQGPDARRHVFASMGIVAVLLMAYRALFPGLFAHNLSWDAMLFDAEIRAAELLMATGVPVLVQLAERFPHEILQTLSESATSGYATLLEQARTLLPALVVSLPYAWLGFQTMRRFDQSLRREVAAVMLATVMAPAITTFVGTAVFWFLAGAALLPLWQLADPDFRGSVSRGRATTLLTPPKRVVWIGLAGLAGMVAGSIVARAALPVYESSASIMFQNAQANVAQMNVASASVEAVLRNATFVSDLERTSGVRLRRVRARPSEADAVRVIVQGYADRDRVGAVTRLAAERAAAALVDIGLDRARRDFSAQTSQAPAGDWRALLPAVDAVFGAGLEGGRRQGRIDQQVADRVPGPIIKTSRKWYDVPILGVGDPSPPILMRQRFVLAGFLIGVGLGLLFLECFVAFGRFRAEAIDPAYPAGSTT